MSEEKKVERDERVAFEAEWKRSGWGDADTKNQCFHFWQARAASTSANVAQTVAEKCARLAELYRDEHAMSGQEEEICNAIAEACRDYGSANVAQGAEAVVTVKVYETYTGQNGWIEVTQEEYDRTKDKYEHRIRRVSAPPAQTADVAQGAEATCGHLARNNWSDGSVTCHDCNATLRSADQPPAQTALTDDARDAARYRFLRAGFGDMGPEVDMHNAFVDGGEVMDRTIDAALTAAQSGEQK